MRTDRQRSGDHAERVVEAGLVANGWRILGRAVRVGRFELDLVAIDPGPPANLVVLEVRFRSRPDFGRPEETVDHRKRRRVREGALRLVALGRPLGDAALPRLPLRLDLVAVEPGPASGGLTVRHHRGVL